MRKMNEKYKYNFFACKNQSYQKKKQGTVIEI